MKAVFVFAALFACVLGGGKPVSPLHGFEDLSIDLSKFGFGNIVPTVVKYSKSSNPHTNQKHRGSYPHDNHVNNGYNNQKNPGYSNTHDVHDNPTYNKPSYTNQGYNKPTYSNQGYNKPTYTNQGYNKPTYTNQGYNKPTYTNQGYNKPTYTNQGYNKPTYNNQHGNQGYGNQPAHGNQGYGNQPAHVDKHPYTPIQLPDFPLPTFGNKQAGVSYHKQPLYHATGPKTYQTPNSQHQGYPTGGYNGHQGSPLVNNHQNYVNQPHNQPHTGNINLPRFPNQVQNYPQVYQGPGSKRPTYTNQVHTDPQPAHYPKLVYNSHPIYKNQHNSNPLSNYQNTGYKTPVHNTGYHAPTYNTGYKAPAYRNNGYKTPTYNNNNGYKAPTYNNNNGYKTPTYNNNNGYKAPTYNNNNGYKATPTYHANGYNNVPTYHKTVGHPHQAPAHKKFDPNNYSVSFNTAYKPQVYNNYKSSNYKNQYRIKPKVYTIKPQTHHQNNHPQGYQNNHPQGYHNTHPQGYQNTHPQGYQNTHPQGYQNNHPTGYQNTHQTGYQKPSLYQNTHQTGYHPTHQAAYPSSNTGYNNAHPAVYPAAYPASH